MLERMVENYNPENPETNATPEEEEIIRYLININKNAEIVTTLFRRNIKINKTIYSVGR